jgi:adhesin transport system outer membrane protein
MDLGLQNFSIFKPNSSDMKLLKILPILVGLSISVSMVNAGEIDRWCITAFDELLAQGLRSHPSISVSKKLILVSDLQLKGANWGYYPTPSVDISRTSSNTRTTFRIDQPLWAGGEIDATYDNAKAEKDEAIYSLAESQYRLIEDYVSTLKKYLQAQDQISIMNDGLLQLDSIMQTIDRMIEADELSLADKNLLTTKIADINSKLTIVKAEFDVAKIQFEILTGKKIKCDVVLENKAIFNDNINIEQLVEDALNFHPALGILNARIDAAKSGIASAQSKLWPTLKLRAEHRKGALYEGDSDREENLIYLVFEMSTGAGASALSNVERSRINVLKVNSQKLAKEKKIIDELMNNYTRFIAVKNNIEILSNDVEVAEDVFNSNKRLFFLQQKKWIEMMGALIILNNKKISKVKLIAEYKALEIELALRTNRLSLETGGVLSDVLQ